MDYIVETDSLCKRYKDKLAVNHMSIHIKKGDIYGLIGKNGAGKTSLMKLLLGFTHPSSGRIRLFNNDDLQITRHKIGALIESPTLYKNESATENLKRFSFLSNKTDDKQLSELLKRVGLAHTGKKKVATFSLGMKQRLGIAIALLGNPELLILDEPINGLDPAGIKEIRDLIISLHQQGITMIISSHLLDELGKIATCYGIVNDGLLIEEISAAQLQERCQTSVVIKTDQPEAAKLLLQQEMSLPEIEIINRQVIIKNQKIDTSLINALLVKADIRVYELKNNCIEFEDFFMERIGK